jgi:Xaa-Pro aminopeptidase
MDPIAARRADIEAKQTALVPILEELECEATLLFMSAHVSWFTAGLNLRGLFAEAERPGVYTNGRQRWILCSNVDSQRLFDEELDQLGFQLKEWTWEGGRADLLANITAGRKIAADRPFPNLKLVIDRLRPLLRELTWYEQTAYREIGKFVAHAVEATARNLGRGQTETEIAGQLGHRLLRHGVEPIAMSIAADGRGSKYRRSGSTGVPVTRTCVIQATGQRDGLYASCARTVSFGPPSDEFRAAHDLAIKQSALYRALTVPENTIFSIGETGRAILANTPYEFDWRFSQPGYGTGRFPAEELRRSKLEDPLVPGQAVVWQPRVGPAAVVDTVIATSGDPLVVTPCEDWPIKRLSIRGGPYHDIPDVLIRQEEE